MEAQNRRNSDLQALYAIRDEIVEIEQIDKKLESIHAKLSAEKKSLSNHNIYPVQKDKNVIHVKVQHYRIHKRKYITVCCITVILYLCFSIATGIFSWMPLYTALADLFPDYNDKILALVCYELLLTIIATIFSVICCTRNID